jgi:predicted nucleic acid-binding protein
MSSLFLDSNILLEGLIARWGLSKAVLSLCAVRIHQLFLAEIVREEVERALLIITSDYAKASRRLSEQILSDYDEFIRLAKPKLIPKPRPQEELAHRHLIRHQHDVPVLVSAINSAPDWLLTSNIEHFNQQVARRTGLRIATPYQFFAAIHASAP